MPPKAKKTGVKNVDIGGAYKLGKANSEQKHRDQVSLASTCRSGCCQCSVDNAATASCSLMHVPCALQDEAVQTEKSDTLEDDIDAELEALAMACVSKPVLVNQSVWSCGRYTNC